MGNALIFNSFLENDQLMPMTRSLEKHLYSSIPMGEWEYIAAKFFVWLFGWGQNLCGLISFLSVPGSPLYCEPVAGGLHRLEHGSNDPALGLQSMGGPLEIFPLVQLCPSLWSTHVQMCAPGHKGSGRGWRSINLGPQWDKSLPSLNPLDRRWVPLAVCGATLDSTLVGWKWDQFSLCFLWGFNPTNNYISISSY